MVFRGEPPCRLAESDARKVVIEHHPVFLCGKRAPRSTYPIQLWCWRVLHGRSVSLTLLKLTRRSGFMHSPHTTN